MCIPFMLEISLHCFSSSYHNRKFESKYIVNCLMPTKMIVKSVNNMNHSLMTNAFIHSTNDDCFTILRAISLNESKQKTKMSRILFLFRSYTLKYSKHFLYEKACVSESEAKLFRLSLLLFEFNWSHDSRPLHIYHNHLNR